MADTQPVGAIPPWEQTDRLVRARRHAGMDQTDIAAALGISVRSVKRYEAGAHIKRGLLLGWALACGVDSRWLTGADNGGVTIGYTVPQAA